MIFTKTKLKGVFVLEIEKLEDERGFFARIWDQKEFKKHGLSSKFVQCSISYNKKKGTLRGMHFQTKPFDEAKLVQCTKGKIYDVVVDLRPKSNTFKEWIAVELDAKEHKMIFIPEGLAHGFQTLQDDTETVYLISEFYNQKFALGVRWNDTAFKILWPLEPTVISKKDESWEFFDEKNFKNTYNRRI